MSDKELNSKITWANLQKVLEEFGDYFIKEARQNLEYGGNPPYTRSNASYALSDSMKTIVVIMDGVYTVSIMLNNYWKYVNNGSDPHWPNVDAIRKWIEIKPIIPQVRPVTYHWYTNGRKKGAPKTIYNERTVMRVPTVDQLAYLIGRKISREGTEGTKFFDKAKEAALKEFEGKIAEAIEKDVDMWLFEVLGETSL